MRRGGEAAEATPFASMLRACHTARIDLLSAFTPNMPEAPLEQSVQTLAGCGPERVEQLRRLGIETIRDLLFHLPRSYEDLTDVRSIRDLRAGTLQTVAGEVVEI